MRKDTTQKQLPVCGTASEPCDKDREIASLKYPLFILYIGIAFIGYGNSNVFSMVFAHALNATAIDKQNEVSGLMIMGLFGGAVFPLAMGLASDAVAAQWGAISVMVAGVIYLMYFNLKLKK